MNWRHLTAFVWLRWRLMRNQQRRAGRLNAVLMTALAVAAGAAAIPLLIGSTALGILLIPRAEPVQLMYVWDGLIVGLLSFWLIGLVAELQRTESLAISKFLHLPVSVGGAFLINYLGSFARLSLIVFAPVMLGYALALVSVKGAVMLPVLPLLAAFLFALTALTYQFQGWLALMMNNPRRRRTIVVVATTAIVLIFQIPNLMNLYGPWGPRAAAERARQAQAAQVKTLLDEVKALELERRSNRIDDDELGRRLLEINARLQAAQPPPVNRRFAKEVEYAARIVNLVLPIGWLPLGTTAAAEGEVWPSLLGLAGLSLIGSASLWRAYRTTIDLYQGRSAGRKKASTAAAEPTAGGATEAPGRTRSESLLERRIPGVPEPAAAVALASLRSLTRSPEAKMMLLTLAVLIAVTGSAVLRGGRGIPESARPLIAFGGMIMALSGLLQLMGNQFGFDRDGFRVYVLSPIRRRDVLLGKNLAFVPLAAILAAAVLALVEAVSPLRADHLLATMPQYISMYLISCIVMNTLSILAPVYVAAGSLKSKNPDLKAALLQFAVFAVAFPLTQAVVLIPIGIEAVLVLSGWPERAPIHLALSLVECTAVVSLYLFALGRLGDLLQSREQRILDVVAGRSA